MPPPATDAGAHDWRGRFDRLGEALAATQHYWHPSPFRGVEPAWCAERPELLERLSALDAPAQGVSLAALADLIPAANTIDALIALPLRPPRRASSWPPRGDWSIPGRKLAQIDAFVGAMGDPCGDFIDWCGGKGHLGRCLASHFDRPVVTFDLDVDLLDAAADLASRGRLSGFTARQQDALADRIPSLAERHVVALHACGELHRRLIRAAGPHRPAALDIAPCCYAKGLTGDYVPLSAASPLHLQLDDLRLAVTGAVTCSAAEQRRRQQAEAWKSGLRLLLTAQGTDYRALSRVPAAWLGGSFKTFCLAMAAREGVTVDDRPDRAWDAAAAAGWAAAHAIALRNSLRLAFAPALEVWLVLDLAAALVESGYDVDVGRFCRHALTPRNLLLSARRAD